MYIYAQYIYINIYISTIHVFNLLLGTCGYVVLTTFRCSVLVTDRCNDHKVESNLIYSILIMQRKDHSNNRLRRLCVSVCECVCVRLFVARSSPVLTQVLFRSW